MSWTFDLPSVCPFSSQTRQRQSKLQPGDPRREPEIYTVLFLTSDVTNSQRSQILTQLCDPEPNDSWPERPQNVGLRPVKAAKWIRNWSPGESSAPSVEACITRMVRTWLSLTLIDSQAGKVRIVPGGETFGKRVGCGMILVDKEALKGLNTKKGPEVIVVTWVWTLQDEAENLQRPDIESSEPEVKVFAARMPIRRANLFLSFAYNNFTQQAFEEIVPNGMKLELSNAGNAILSQDNKREGHHENLPQHHSISPRVTKDKIEVISLVHLTDREIENLIVKIGRPRSELEEKESASSESNEEGEETRSKKRRKTLQKKGVDKDTQVLPIKIYNWATHEPCSRPELYRMFQDIQPASLPKGQAKYALFADIPDPSTDSRSEPEILLVKQSHQGIRRKSCSPENFIELFKWRESESVMELWPLIYGSMSGQDEVKSKKRLWYESSWNAFELVPNPDKFVWPQHQMNCFILIELSETDLRKMKSRIQEQHDVESLMEFIEVGAYLSSPDIKGLMLWFEECMINGIHPPHDFVAVDQQSFDYYVKNDGDKDEAMVIGSSESLYNRHNDAHVHDFIGLGFGRLNTYDAIISSLGLGVGNQSFEGETLPQEKITYLYWSDILEAERLPGRGVSLKDPEYTKEGQVFTAQPKDIIE